MDKPRFIQNPPSETVLETAQLLARHKTMRQIAAIRHLSYETIKDHTRILRYLFHTHKTNKAVKRMLRLNYITDETDDDDFPPHWKQYIIKDKPKL